MQTHPGTCVVGECSQERLRLESESQHSISDCAAREVGEHPFQNGALAEWQQWFGCGVGERTQARAETTDKYNGEHAARDLLARVDEQLDFAGCWWQVNFGAIWCKHQRNGQTVVVQTNRVKVGD